MQRTRIYWMSADCEIYISEIRWGNFYCFVLWGTKFLSDIIESNVSESYCIRKHLYSIAGFDLILDSNRILNVAMNLLWEEKKEISCKRYDPRFVWRLSSDFEPAKLSDDRAELLPELLVSLVRTLGTRVYNWMGRSPAETGVKFWPNEQTGLSSKLGHLLFLCLKNNRHFETKRFCRLFNVPHNRRHLPWFPLLGAEFVLFVWLPLISEVYCINRFLPRKKSTEFICFAFHSPSIWKLIFLSIIFWNWCICIDIYRCSKVVASRVTSEASSLVLVNLRMIWSERVVFS